ncbi:HASI-like protein, partial [Leptotrombidium deliense]
VFSKYARVVPLKTKSAKAIIKAFSTLIKSEKPEKLQYDKGKEFNNQYLKMFLNKLVIVNYPTENERLMCVVVERFHRTLKSRMFQYFTAYIDILPKLVEGYNRSFHSSIKMAPADVKSSNSKLVFENVYKNDFFKPPAEAKFEIGESVRLVNEGYKRRWTNEIYTIVNIINRPTQKMYVVDDFDNEV